MPEFVTALEAVAWWQLPVEALFIVVAFALGFMTIGTMK